MILILALIACGDDGGGSTTSAAGGESPSTTAGDSGEDALRQTLACDVSPTAEELVDYQLPEPNEAYDITLLQVSLAGYYYQAIDLGRIPPARRPGVEVTTLAAEGYASPDLQLSQVEDAIAGGPMPRDGAVGHSGFRSGGRARCRRRDPGGQHLH